MKWTQADYQFMSRALQIARRGLYTSHPNPRVGCILVKDNRIIGEGWHQTTGGPHAEINALNSAGQDASGADCYVSLEPCSHSGRTPPCTEALIRSGVRRVVAATTDPNPLVSGQGLTELRSAGIQVESGLMAKTARELNPGFEKRMRNKLPLVRCKLAMSLDGRTALADGTSRWITDLAARKDVQRLRARASAIMTGVDSVIHDNPEMNVRDIDCQGRQPLRVILDRQLRTPAVARILEPPGEIIIFTHQSEIGKSALMEQDHIEVVHLDPGGHFIKEALSYLAVKKEVNDVLLECGATLAGAMMNEGLVDELVIYIAPTLLGHEARPLMIIPGIETMNARIDLEYKDIRMVGKDCRITLLRKHYDS